MTGNLYNYGGKIAPSKRSATTRCRLETGSRNPSLQFSSLTSHLDLEWDRLWMMMIINSCNDLALGHCKDAKMRSSVQQLWCVDPGNILELAAALDIEI